MQPYFTLQNQQESFSEAGLALALTESQQVPRNAAPLRESSSCDRLLSMTSQLPNPQEPNPPAPDDLATAELNELFNQHLATLRQQAAHHMGRQNKDHTLQPTALVNEVYVRLQKAGRADWEDRTHFLRVASKAMRSILVDNFRKKNSLKGGGKKEDRELDQITVSFEENGYDLEALDMALTELAVSQPLMAEAVQLRFFGGAEMKEVAEALNMPLRTLERNWKTTRAMLRRALK